MLNSSDRKFRKWSTIQREFQKLEEKVSLEVSNIRDDSSLCLTHGYHHHRSYAFKDVIRCAAYRSNAVTEEFIINHGFGTGNVLQIKSFGKDSQAIEAAKEEDAIEDGSKISNQEELIHINSPPLQHLVWLQKHRLFVGLGSDKNLRVFSDTSNRCQTLSAPTCCTMPIICLVYLEETDEVVTAGLGSIRPWKIRFSSSMQLCEAPEGDVERQAIPRIKKVRNTNEQGEGRPEMKRAKFGQGGQMLQKNPPYCCDLEDQEWVTSLRVYSEAKTTYRITEGCKHVLVATAADIVIAIDYVKRMQLWSARLRSTFTEGTDVKAPKKRKTKTEQKHTSPEHPASSYTIKGHLSLTACEFYPRLGYFITGGGEGTIQIMQLVNFGTVTTLRGHRFAITGLVVHSKHPILISSSKDGCIRIWCLETFREIQRIDTEQHVENISLSDNSKFFFFHSKKMIGMYYYHNLYSLYSIPHSVPESIIPIDGDASRSYNGRMLVALADGSVALLSPKTGLMITMIYPMTTFQIFKDMVFDIYRGMCYIRLQDGCILQCDCTSNPSAPLLCFKSTIPDDEDVCSMASVRIQFSDGLTTPTTAVIAGLCNGQIILVRPNFLWMDNVQAHVGPVGFLLTIPDVRHESVGEEAYCRDQVFSIGPASVRIWHVAICEFDELSEGDITVRRGKVATRLFRLLPVIEVFPPEEALHPTLVSALEDRLCITKGGNRLIILEINKNFVSPAICTLSHAENTCAVDASKSHANDDGKFDPTDFSRDQGMVCGKEGQNTVGDITRHTQDDMLRYEQQNTIVYNHDKEDCHVQDITCLASAHALRFFASGSEDGYVKLWDEKNRLLRELYLTPNPVTAISFVNGRDLLVAFEGRIFAVECSAFLTSELITKRRIADLEFTEMPSEDAFPYNNYVAILSNIEHLPTTGLVANTRSYVDDEITEERARLLVKDGDDSACRLERDTITPRTQRYFDQTSTTNFKVIEDETETKRKSPTAQGNKVFGAPRRRVLPSINRKNRRDSIFDDAGSTVVLVTQRNAQKKKKSYNDFEEFLRDFGENKEASFRDDELNQEKLRLSIREQEFKLEKDVNWNDVIYRIPVAPDGYIPNSVVRTKVKASSPFSPDKEAKTKSLFVLPEFEHQEYGAIDSESSLDYDPSSTESLQNRRLLSFGEGFDDELARRQHILGAIAIEEPETSNENAPGHIMELYDFDEDSDEYKKYMMQTTQPRKVSFARRLRKHSEDEYDGSSYSTSRRRGKKGRGRIPSYRQAGKVVRATRDTDSGGTIVGDPARKKSRDIGEVHETEVTFSDAMDSITQSLSNDKKGVRGDDKAKAEMMAKMQKEKREAAKSKKKPRIHPLLQEITKAAWFRAKLSDITAEEVVKTLLNIGNTTRIVAHQKVCENLTKILKTFGPEGVERLKMGNNLTDPTIERIRRFIASYLKPRYSVYPDGRHLTNLELEEEQKRREESRKSNPNRVQLAHSALDAIENGVGITKFIEAGIIRLSVDENEGIRNRATRLLTEYLGIDSRRKIIAKLEEFTGGQVLSTPEPRPSLHDEALTNLDERMKQGRLSVSKYPKLAERLFPRKHAISVSDESPAEQLVTDGQTTTRKLTTVRRTTASGDCGFSFSDEMKKNIRRVGFHQPRNEPKQKGSIMAMAKFGKINWRKAIPQSTKDTIKMMRTMTAVHTAMRDQVRKQSAEEALEAKRRPKEHKEDSTKSEFPRSSTTGTSTTYSDEEERSDRTQEGLYRADEFPTTQQRSDLSIPDDAKHSVKTDSLRLPPLEGNSHPTTMTLLANPSVTRHPPSGITVYDVTDSALGGSEYIPFSTTRCDETLVHSLDVRSSTAIKLRKQDIRDEDSGYNGTNTQSVDTTITQWRLSLESLREMKKEKAKLRRRSFANSVPSLPPIDSPAGEPQPLEHEVYLTKQRRPAKVDVATSTSRFEDCHDSYVYVPSEQKSARRRPTMSGKMKYDSFRWMQQAIVAPNLRNAPSTAKVRNNVETRSAHQPQRLKDDRRMRAYKKYISGLKDASNTIAQLRENEQHCRFSDAENDRPLSLFDAKNKALKDILTNRILSQRRKLTLPKIEAVPSTPTKRTITIRLPSCKSKFLCATPSDVTDIV